MSSMTIAQLQTHVFSDKMQNIEALRPLIQKAKNSGAAPMKHRISLFMQKKQADRSGRRSLTLQRNSGSTFPPDPSRNVTRTDMFSIPPMSLTEVESRLPATEKSTSSTLM